MTRHYFLMAAMLAASFYISACSPVNSMEPFDDKQAAIVARGMYPRYFMDPRFRGDDTEKRVISSPVPTRGSTNNSAASE